MISKKFLTLSNDDIIEYVSDQCEDCTQCEDSNMVSDSVTSVSDLWVLANIYRSYINEKNN